MTRSDLTTSTGEFVVQVGKESLPVLGNMRSGWPIGADSSPDVSSYRYTSLDELLFALINLSVATDGIA
jgi:hypothetical protein